MGAQTRTMTEGFQSAAEGLEEREQRLTDRDNVTE